MKEGRIPVRIVKHPGQRATVSCILTKALRFTIYDFLLPHCKIRLQRTARAAVFANVEGGRNTEALLNTADETLAGERHDET
jgi:hypothetical protein